MNQDNKGLILLSFIAIYFIWGSTYMFNKYVLSEIPPLMLSGLRFTIAGLLVFGIAKLKGILITPSKTQLKNTFIAGVHFIAIGNGFVIFGLQYIDSGFTALVIAIQPLILLVMMRFIMKHPIVPKALIGIFLGLLGMYLLIDQNTLVHHPKEWIGLLCIFVSLLTWSYGSIFIVKADLPKNYFVNAGYQMLVGGILLSIASWIYGDQWSGIMNISMSTFWSLVYLIIFGSIAAFTAYNYLLKHVSPEKVSTSTYVNPIVAVFLGWWILDEVITGQSILAAFILLTGVYFINTNKVTNSRVHSKS